MISKQVLQTHLQRSVYIPRRTTILQAHLPIHPTNPLTKSSLQRIEHDAFGPVQIPAARYWGGQTQRALATFGDSGFEKFPPCLIHAFGLQKMAAANANFRLGQLDQSLTSAIYSAAEEVSHGKMDREFPLSIWQTGSGTQTNMCANEVIANRANQLLLNQPLGTKSPIHPNDHVNRSQSSNDTFPTVMHVASVLAVRSQLLPVLVRLRQTFQRKANEFSTVVKIGRTHLMDAVPMTVGQGFDSYAHQVANAIRRLEQGAIPGLLRLAQGGTAVGTGLNTPRGFDAVFCEELATLTGEKFVPNPSKFEGMGSHDSMVELSGVLNTLAVSMLKIANDLRFLGSGPYCGLGELNIPSDGLSSSIMPGKRNPTLAEVLVQACFQVMGNHVTVTMAGGAGTFELNVAKPVIIYNVLQSVKIMADSIDSFRVKLVEGIQVNRDRLAQNVASSLLVATSLNTVLGYDQVAKITSRARDQGITPRQATLDLGLMTGDEYDRLTDPLKLALPHSTFE